MYSAQRITLFVLGPFRGYDALEVSGGVVVALRFVSLAANLRQALLGGGDDLPRRDVVLAGGDEVLEGRTELRGLYH